jgi:hypothetical protein
MTCKFEGCGEKDSMQTATWGSAAVRISSASLRLT